MTFRQRCTLALISLALTACDGGAIGGNPAGNDPDQGIDASMRFPDDRTIPTDGAIDPGTNNMDAGPDATTTPDGSTPPPPPPPPPPPQPLNYYKSTVSLSGVVDVNNQTYMYAPALVYADGLYHYYACVGVSGDWIMHKAASSVTGLAAAQWNAVLIPDPDENHNCDPSIIRGTDGNWYLHYSNTPGGQYTDAGVAVSNHPGGPYLKITKNLLGHYSNLSPGQYGRGQTSVTRGPDGAYYMAFTNQIAPLEPNGIVILKSSEPSFSKSRTEVARLDVNDVGGWSTHLSYDPQSKYFVFVEPAGEAGFSVTSFNTSWKRVRREILPRPPGAGVPGEGQAILTDAEGRIITDSPGANGNLTIVGATSGPNRGYPTHITGPNQWHAFRVNPTGVVDQVAGLAGKVRVTGWSFDPNDVGFALDTHVYIKSGGTQEGTNLGATDV
ncbi:MAG: hypothetical protein KC417_00370, partial [Myxococcales bacterium]|nr:hypothetical protein [Myxococcales bacterium]